MTKRENWYNCPSRRKRKLIAGRGQALVLRNSLHGTVRRLYLRYYQPLTHHQIKTCRQKLCPVGKACRCGGRLKERGPQDVRVQVTFDLAGREVITLEPLRGSLLYRPPD